MTEDARPGSQWRNWLVHVTLLLVPWAIYFAVLSLQPADRLGAWHNDIAWPGDHYLTVGLEGLVFPFLFYMGFAVLGGLVIGVVMLMLTAGVRRLLLMRRDFSEWAGLAGMIVAPALVFVMKVVPLVVTEVDPEARLLVVREFHWLLRYPIGEREIAADQIEALDLTTHFHRGSGYLLEIHALTRGFGAVRLGQRACESPEIDVCLRSGEADMVELARLLGREGGRPDASGRDGHRVLRFEP